MSVLLCLLLPGLAAGWQALCRVTGSPARFSLAPDWRWALITVRLVVAAGRGFPQVCAAGLSLLAAFGCPAVSAVRRRRQGHG